MAFASAAGWRFRERGLLRLQAALLGMLCFAAGGVPRLIPALFGALALVAAIHALLVDPKLPLRLLKTPVAAAFAAFIVYLFINATWSPDRAEGLAKAATVLGLAFGVVLFAASSMLRTPEEARVLAKSALAGLLLGGAFLLIELVSDQATSRFINNHIVQLFDLTRKKVQIENGEVTKMAEYILNRNVTSLVLLLVPSLLFSTAIAVGRTRLACVAALVAGAGVCVLLSQSGTSVLAFFAGALVLGLAALSLKATRRLLAATWVILTLFAVPLGALPYDLGWQNWTWLPPESVAARFYIWKYTADKVAERPITGIGIRGTRSLHVDTVIDPLTGREATAALRPGRHAHNVFLQTWLELGAIGAVLLLGVGVAGLLAMSAWPRPMQASAYGLFAVSVAVGISGFDMWQTWLLGALAFAWSAMMLAARLPALAGRTEAERGHLGRSGNAALPATTA